MKSKELKDKIIKLITEENFDKFGLNVILEFVKERKKKISILNKEDKEGNLYYLVRINDETGDEGAYWLYATTAEDEEKAIKNAKRGIKTKYIMSDIKDWHSLVTQLARLQYQLGQSHCISVNAPKYIEEQKINELKYIGEPIKE